MSAAAGTQHFCTLFDRNYVDRGLALGRSLQRHAPDAMQHVLCLDEATLSALDALRLPRTELVSLETLERWDPALREARANRAPVEFFFTCKPVLLAYLLERNPGAARATYLDSDLFHFSAPSPEAGGYAQSAVALTPHRFAARNAERIRYGRFNAGWVSVRADTTGRRFLAWWRERCLEWCRLVVEPERFGDQKYLDRAPELFGATVLEHPGINAGPWNIDAGTLQQAGDGTVRLGDRPLVSFHFHGMKPVLGRLWDSGLHEYGVPLSRTVRDALFAPYAAALAAARQDLARLQGDALPRASLDLRGAARRLRWAARLLAQQSAVSVPG